MEKLRLLEIHLENIQSVEHGTISFPDYAVMKKNPFDLEEFRGSILGIYGQNGSGKTTVPLAVTALISFVTIGFAQPHPNDPTNRLFHSFPHLLTKGADRGSIRLTCGLLRDERCYLLQYTILLYSREGFGPAVEKETIRVQIYDEETGTYKLYLPELSVNYVNDTIDELYYDGIAHRKGKIGDFAPENALGSVGPLLGRKYANASISMSFLFSQVYIQSLGNSDNQKRQDMAKFLSLLFTQFKENVFLYGPRNDALQNMGMGFILGGAKVQTDHGVYDTHGALPFNLPVTAKQAATYRSVTEQINVLLGAAVPGFKIKLLQQAIGKAPDGQSLYTLQWVRLLGKGEIPISCESNGIQKLIHLSSALVLTSGNPSMWFFIDEYDSGVYEQLLSQLVKSFLEVGKGQILFTAHNLRGLEILPTNHIVFATANAKERFITFKGLKPSNNLRDQYIRALTLGGQSEPLLDQTSIADIERAMQKAFTVYEDSSMGGKRGG